MAASTAMPFQLITANTLSTAITRGNQGLSSAM